VYFPDDFDLNVLMVMALTKPRVDTDRERRAGTQNYCVMFSPAR